MRALILAVLLLVPSLAVAQQSPPPDPIPPPTQYPPQPPGMRVIVGAQGALPRNEPSLAAMCGTPPHACTTADAVAANVYGVILADPPVLEPAGWYWQKITFDTAVTGWVSAYPPYINLLQPNQMVAGSAFTIVGDYSGPSLTQAVCIKDGINSAATMQLQPVTSGVQGVLLCPWSDAGIGNHKAAIIAVNGAGTMLSAEFQFSVTAAPVPTVPTAPQNLRIGPIAGTTTQRLQDVKPATPTTAKPAAPAPVKK
jgi:hypothetical protein